MDVLQEGDLIMLVSRDRKQYLVRLETGAKLHSSRGVIAHDDLIGSPPGREVRTHMGYPFLVLEASTSDLTRLIKRTTQIMFPKDISYVMMRLNLFPGRRIIEAGTGSGSLTVALARQICPTGKVYSYESKPETQRLARRNLEQFGLIDFVDLKAGDITDGFEERNVDAVFLDVRQPWEFLAQVAQALKPGGFFGSILPTTNQVSELLDGLQRHGEFAFTEVEELILRPYKAVPARLRPIDRMVAHTGYLIFARRIVGGLDAGWLLPAHGRRRAMEELGLTEEALAGSAHAIDEEDEAEDLDG